MRGQRQLLDQVLAQINSYPRERRLRVFEARAKVLEIAKEYGEDGLMGVAIVGLEHAAQAEDEEAARVMEQG